MGQKYENRPKTGTKRATRGRFMSTVVNKIRRDLMTTTEATQQTKTQPPRWKKGHLVVKTTKNGRKVQQS